METERHLEQLERLVADARPVPLSASVMVGKRELEQAIAGLKAELPEDLRQSRWVLKERDEVIDQARREADRLLADAQEQADRLVSETEVMQAARREAERVLEEAREQARVLRLEAEDYVDGKLANFEIVRSKTMEAVERGRERLRGRLASDELADAQPEPAAAEDDEAGGAHVYDHEQGA